MEILKFTHTPKKMRSREVKNIAKECEFDHCYLQIDSIL